MTLTICGAILFIYILFKILKFGVKLLFWLLLILVGIGAYYKVKPKINNTDTNKRVELVQLQS